MRIECPSCNAAYDVPPERLVAGRAVKCARCAKTWVPVSVQAPQCTVETVTETVAEPAMSGPDVHVDPPATLMPQREPLTTDLEPRRRSRAPLVAAWLLSIAILGALGWAAVDRRAAIMAAWPPSLRAYAAIGLAASQ